MSKFRLYFILFFISLTLFSCHKNDDSASAEPPRDRAEQYVADIDLIENYLKTHYLRDTIIDGLTDIKITAIPEGGPQTSIWDNTQYPLQSKMVKNDNRKTNYVDGISDDTVDYKLYYLILNEGGGTRPATNDSTYVTYRGWKLDGTQFDKTITPLWTTYPVILNGEQSFISGFRQFLPQMKAAFSSTSNGDGTTTFNNYGTGVVFIPSGLGYFNTPLTGIPAYSPLVFTVQLDAVAERDHDLDHILSKLEDRNNDGDVYNDDTDGDNIPDFLDADDDGDNYLTKSEVHKDIDGNILFEDTDGDGIPNYLDVDNH